MHPTSGIGDPTDPLDPPFLPSTTGQNESMRTKEEIPPSFIPSYSKVLDNTSPGSPGLSKRVFSPTNPVLLESSTFSSTDSESDENDREKDFKASDDVDAMLRIPILPCKLETGFVGSRTDKDASILDLPPLDTSLTTLDEGIFEWSISDFISLFKYKELHSPVFKLENNSYWKLLLFPRSGSSNSLHQVSLYLMRVVPQSSTDLADKKTLCVQFSLSITSPSTSEVLLQRTNSHRFIGMPESSSLVEPQESLLSELNTNTPVDEYRQSYVDCQDWGYLSFIPTTRLLRVCIKSDSSLQGLKIFALIRIIDDPIGNLWIDPCSYDSRRECGYVGLRNQGATCYMNSLLQSLFMTTAFRQATFMIPTSPTGIDSYSGISTGSIPLALQRLFYSLQVSHEPVSTTELTRSFGWKSIESFYQRDVQEFSRLLMDALERKMKGTPVEQALDEIFKGETIRYVRCLNVPYESTGKEAFYDIAVTVKGMPSLEDSLKSYIEPEFLTGDNRYNAEGYGLQDAKLGVIFASLPPVLHFQLKRFEYDFERDRVIKINDQFEFPELLDMSCYMINVSDQNNKTTSISAPSIYRLHGVLVHSGDVGGGHYYAFIRSGPSEENKWGTWLRFDDENVHPVSSKEAINDNFGSSLIGTSSSTKRSGGASLIKRFTSAYMLVYILESKWMEMIGGLPVVPEHIISSNDILTVNEENRAYSSNKNDMLVNVHLITDVTFRETYIEDAPGLDFLNATESATLLSKPSTSTLAEFSAEVEDKCGISSFNQYYYLVNDDNTLHLLSLNTRFEELMNSLIYLTYCIPDEDSNNIIKDPILVFFKTFEKIEDKDLPSLSFQASLVVNSTCSISMFLRSILNLEDLSEWILFEESSIDSGDFSHRIDASLPIGQQLNTHSNRQGVVLILVSRSYLSIFETTFSSVNFSLIPGEAMLELGIDKLSQKKESTLSNLVSSLFDNIDDLFNTYDTNDLTIRKIEVLTSWNEWVDVPEWNLLPITQMLSMAGWKGFRLCNQKFFVRYFSIFPVLIEDQYIKVNLYRPLTKDFIRAHLFGKTLDHSLLLISKLRQKAIDKLKANGQMDISTHSLLDFLTSVDPISFSNLNLLEAVDGMIVRILKHTDPLDVIGNRSQVYLIDPRFDSLMLSSTMISSLNISTKLIRIIHTKPNQWNTLGTTSIQQRLFGIPFLFQVISSEPLETTLKRMVRHIPGITEFDAAAGRGTLKIYHIRPLGNSNSDSLLFSVSGNKSDNLLISTGDSSNEDNGSTAIKTLYDYITQENVFNLDLDLLALEHPERSLPPIKEISQLVPPSPSSTSPDRSVVGTAPISIWSRPGDSMRIN